MGFNGQFHSDQWHHDAENITIRDGIKSRRWGMRVTVYDDPTPANNGEWLLTYSLTNTDLQDNANWFKSADIGQAWGAAAPVVYTFVNGIEETAGVVFLAATAGSIINTVVLTSHNASQISLGSYTDAGENQGSLIDIGPLSLNYIYYNTPGDFAGLNFGPTGSFFEDFRPVPVGIQYGGDYSASFTNRSLPDVEYVTSHFGTVALSTIAQSPGVGQDGFALVWDNGSLEYTLAAVPTNTAATNELPKSDAGGNLIPTGIASINPGELELGLAALAGDTRIIRTTGSEANINIVIAGKGNAAISFSPGGTIDGFAVSSVTGTSILYSINGLAGADDLLMIRHSAKETGFSHIVTSTEAILRGGHTGTGALSLKSTFSIIGRSSESTANGGDDITITGGNGSNSAGHINTPGGSISINGGIGGTDSVNDGGDVHLSGGAGGGGGNRGNIFFDLIPTSAVGLPTGAIYSNAGVLTQAP